MGILFAKLYNLAHKGRGYDSVFLFGGFAASLLFWLLIFMSFVAAVQYEDTITDGTDTYTVTSNEHIQLSIYLPFANVLVLLNTVLTAIEALLLFSKSTIMPLGYRGRGR